MDPLEQHAQAMGVDVEQIRDAVKRVIPMLELVAQMTTNKYDDLVVELLKKLVA